MLINYLLISLILIVSNCFVKYDKLSVYFLVYKDVDCDFLEMNELKIRFSFYDYNKGTQFFFANQFVIKRV